MIRKRYKEREREHYHKNKIKLALQMKARNLFLKQQAITRYGGKCQLCPEERLVVLEIDHIDGGGGRHRRDVIKVGTIHRWLYRNNYPDGFRVLCRNCNWIAYREKSVDKTTK